MSTTREWGTTKWKSSFGNIVVLPLKKKSNEMDAYIFKQKQYGMIMNLLVRNLTNVPTRSNNFAFINCDKETNK